MYSQRVRKHQLHARRARWCCWSLRARLQNRSTSSGLLRL
jgi:hypothetical protein